MKYKICIPNFPIRQQKTVKCYLLKKTLFLGTNNGGLHVTEINKVKRKIEKSFLFYLVSFSALLLAQTQIWKEKIEMSHEKYSEGERVEER